MSHPTLTSYHVECETIATGWLPASRCESLAQQAATVARAKMAIATDHAAEFVASWMAEFGPDEVDESI